MIFKTFILLFFLNINRVCIEPSKTKSAEKTLEDSSLIDSAVSPDVPSTSFNPSLETGKNSNALKNNLSQPQKKRYYREEWRIVKNDKIATEDRLENLIINNKDSWGMWCNACTKFAPKLGMKYCTNFVKDKEEFKPPRPKKETVDSHFASSSHHKCAEIAKSNEQPQEAAPVYQKLIEIDPGTFQKMKNLMRIVFYFAIKDRSAKEFSSECELQKMNGAILGNTYLNEVSFKNLLKYIALSLQNKIIAALNNTQFFSVLSDGSTTKKSTEYEAVVIRYIDKESSKVTNSFVGLCNVEDASAPGIRDIITKCLDNAQLQNWREKLICMTVDGASVNIGKHNGVVKLIDSPTYIHCYNHVLDLCLKEVIKSNAMAVKCMGFVKQLSTFYRTSPKLTRELTRASEILNVKLLSFKPVCETRWADSLENAVIPILRNYVAIVQHLTDVVSEHNISNYSSSIKLTAKSLLKDLRTYEILHFFYAFSDFVIQFSNTSKNLEKADLDIIEAMHSVKSLQIALNKFTLSELPDKDSKNLVSFLNCIDDSDNDSIVFQNITLEREKSKRKSKEEDNLKNMCNKAHEVIERRFFNSEGGDSVIFRLAKVLNPVFFPKELSQNFGESEIIEFCSIFNISSKNAVSEWIEFRQILFENFRPEITIKDLYEKLLTQHFANMKTIKQIIEIILTIAPSNAEVERVWSSFSHILDDRSLSMAKETLEYRLKIKHSKCNLNDFDPTDAVQLWWSHTVRSRRPNFK